MLTINVICIGKLKEDFLRQAQNEYSKRLQSFCKLNVIELPECRTIEDEGQLILSKLRGHIIPLCIEGKSLPSVDFAMHIAQVSVNGISEITFVIGGSMGLSAAVKALANVSLSMSLMTFPHQLARIMLLEQIYRAFQINTNGKYHK